MESSRQSECANPNISPILREIFVVFTVGGNSILTPKVSDEIVAFTLPD
jgi:hypothetical protein